MRVLLTMAAAFLITLGILEACTPHDDSDPPDDRSGLRIYKDALTGCEYLSTGIFFTPLTPRMHSDGVQVCRRTK